MNGLDPNTIRRTLSALAHVGPTDFYDQVDYYVQHNPNMTYEMALVLVVHEITKDDE